MWYLKNFPGVIPPDPRLREGRGGEGWTLEYRYQPDCEVFHLFNKSDLGDLDEVDSCSDPEDQAFSD
jgi:hypothetical protein